MASLHLTATAKVPGSFFASFDFLFFRPIWHIRENRPLQKDATRHAAIFHYSMPHSDNFTKFDIFQIFRSHFSKISVSKSEFVMPTYQPTTITLSISIDSTLFSLSIAISGGMRVHFMKESVPSQTFALLQDTTCCFLEDRRCALLASMRPSSQEAYASSGPRSPATHTSASGTHPAQRIPELANAHQALGGLLMLLCGSLATLAQRRHMLLEMRVSWMLIFVM